jgi:WD40 repeat protein
MTLSPDGRHLLTADAGRRIHTTLVGGGERFEPAGDFRVQMLGVPRGEKVREWTIDGWISGPVAFGPDGKTFAVAAREVGQSLHVYDTETGRLLAEIDGFNGYPWAIAFSNDGRLLATSLTCGSVLIWDWKQFMQ